LRECLERKWTKGSRKEDKEIRIRDNLTDLTIKHIQLIIDGKEYFISFHYSLLNGIKEVSIDGKPAEVIDAYPALPKLAKIYVKFILIDLRTIAKKIARKMKGHSRLDEHK